MLYSGFNILPRSVFWPAYFNGRSDNTDVMSLNQDSNSRMDIANAVAHLESLGLHVSQHVPGALTDRNPTDGLTVARSVVPIGELDSLVDVCLIFPLRCHWCYRNWIGIGGRAPDDVHIENLSLDLAIQYAESFYFGLPLNLDNWIFPINCHPEWDANLISVKFGNARTYTDAEWRVFRAEHHANIKTLTDDARFRLKYREIESIPPSPDLRLWMRNDLSDMYFVRRP